MRIGRIVHSLSCALLIALAVPVLVSAQGVTTGSVAGFTTDSSGAPIANASVVAVHLATGTQYRAVYTPRPVGPPGRQPANCHWYRFFADLVFGSGQPAGPGTLK